MNITNIILARTVWLIDIRLLNPSGLAFGPIHKALVENYKFLVYPTIPSEFDLVKGVKYTGGEFTFGGDKISVDLVVYNNGWSADTISTEASAAFLNDLMGWLGTSFKLQADPKSVTKVIYDSQFYFTSDINLSESCEKFITFSALVSEYSGKEEQCNAVLFQSSGAPFSTFSFERRANASFPEKQYYSRSSLPTSKHIELLQKFERIFGGLAQTVSS